MFLKKVKFLEHPCLLLKHTCLSMNLLVNNLVYIFIFEIDLLWSQFASFILINRLKDFPFVTKKSVNIAMLFRFLSDVIQIYYYILNVSLKLIFNFTICLFYLIVDKVIDFPLVGILKLGILLHYVYQIFIWYNKHLLTN